MGRSKVVALVVFLLMSAMAGPQTGWADQPRPRIGMVQFGVEPNVEVCKQGILKALAEEGYKEGETIDIVYKNAQADFGLVYSCIQDLMRRKVDIIVPLSTPCLQAAAQAASRDKDLKVVFTYAYDPYRLGVAKTPEDHLPNVTGVSCFPPIERALDTIRAVFPDRKDVGIIWNSSEANSEAVLTKVRAHAPAIGLHLIEATVTNPGEVLEASRSLVTRGARVFLNAGDNTLNVGYDSFIKVADEKKIPVFSVDSELTQGTLIIVGPDYHQTGQDGGRYISRVLKGEKTSDLPIYQTKETMFIVNMEVARRQGFIVPEEILKKANRLIGAESLSN